MICAHSEDDPPMAEGLSEEVYEVQRILKKTVDDNGIFYLVRHLQIFWARTFIDLSYTFVLQKADIAWNLNKNILKKKHNFLGSLEGIRPRRGLMGTRREFGLCLCCNQDFRGQGSWKVRSLNFWSYFVGKHYCKVHLSLVYKNSDNLKTECKWSLQEILKLHFDCFFKHFHQICLSKNIVFSGLQRRRVRRQQQRRSRVAGRRRKVRWAPPRRRTRRRMKEDGTALLDPLPDQPESQSGRNRARYVLGIRRVVKEEEKWINRSILSLHTWLSLKKTFAEERVACIREWHRRRIG